MSRAHTAPDSSTQAIEPSCALTKLKQSCSGLSPHATSSIRPPETDYYDTASGDESDFQGERCDLRHHIPKALSGLLWVDHLEITASGPKTPDFSDKANQELDTLSCKTCVFKEQPITKSYSLKEQAFAASIANNKQEESGNHNTMISCKSKASHSQGTGRPAHSNLDIEELECLGIQSGCADIDFGELETALAPDSLQPTTYQRTMGLRVTAEKSGLKCRSPNCQEVRGITSELALNFRTATTSCETQWAYPSRSKKQITHDSALANGLKTNGCYSKLPMQSSVPSSSILSPIYPRAGQSQAQYTEETPSLTGVNSRSKCSLVTLPCNPAKSASPDLELAFPREGQRCTEAFPSGQHSASPVIPSPRSSREAVSSVHHSHRTVFWNEFFAPGESITLWEVIPEATKNDRGATVSVSEQSPRGSPGQLSVSAEGRDVSDPGGLHYNS